MPFIPSDLYLASSIAPIVTSWVPEVSKHNTSSFYNWEQDNLPLYDLEDRDKLLWYKQGYPTSTLPGIMMVVSGDANFIGDSSGIIFKNVSSCIKALPDVINCPIIIEIATWGNLGELNLNNIKFGPTGGLEIVNRVFGKGYSASSVVNAAGGLNISSTDIKNTINNTSALALSTLVVSSTTSDTRWNSSQTILTQRLETDLDGSNELFLSKDVASFYNFGVADKLSFSIYSTDSSITNFDHTTYHDITNIDVHRTSLAVADKVEFLLYGNYFTSIKVDNCNNDKLFLRNLCVDGATGTGVTLVYNTLNGFEINNSKLLIENCSVLRCKQTGFNILNSKVIVSRGALAYRIYDLSAYNSRSDYESAGFRITNSEITVSSHQYASGVDMMFNSCRNTIGWDINDSLIKGGNRRKDNSTYSTSAVSFFPVQFNTKIGIRLNNSILAVDGRLDITNNYRGIEANNSVVNLDEASFEYNKKEGLIANNSTITYNKNLTRATTIYNSITQNYFNANGQHLILNESKFVPVQVSAMPDNYGTTYMLSSFGANKKGSTYLSLPSVEINNGSYAEFAHIKIYNPQIPNTYAGADAIYGAAISVNNGSEAIFKASRNQATHIVGIPDYDIQQKNAGVYAGENSVVEFNGPTFIAQYGVDVLAEKGSTIKINPHQKGTSLDVSGWQLNNQYNHTKVELHATRACLVANNQSNIKLSQLGSYIPLWAASVATSAADYNLNNILDLSAYTASGYLQFYPNPQDKTSVTNNTSRYNPVTSISVDETDVDYFLQPVPATNPTAMLTYSIGGTCVRAVKGSVVEVMDVHFPAGWNNPSGIYYDVSAGTCERLYIWNIADDSELHASYCSVSGLYPSLAGYNGPSAVYVSSGGWASGAPQSTPNTSSLSVLDSYGMGGPSGQASFLNKGPFRLYMSPMGVSKFLFASGNASGIGIPYQILAQGYNPSSVCSATGTSLSSTYLELASPLKFYYVSSMLDPSYQGRIMLDESAANTFANAKNANYGTSGRLKLVTIYRAGTEAGGESFDAADVGLGKGFRSARIFDLNRIN